MKYEIIAQSPIATPEFTVNMATRRWHRLLLVRAEDEGKFVLKEQEYDGFNGEWYDALVLKRGYDITDIMSVFLSKLDRWRTDGWLVASYVI